jgi:formyl-CoA transferase
MGALSGVKVLDVATLFPAPVLAAMLGDFGADVVKVEPRDGDPLRAIGPVPWAVAGRNKRSVRLDFDTTDGLVLLGRLIQVTDVVVLNQPAAVLERWGCTDEAIAARNPRAIVVHVSAFGTTGPYAARVGNGTLAEAFVGLPSSGVPLGDALGAITGAFGVLAALYWRDAGDGHGQVIDVSLYEALLQLLGPAVAGVSGVRSFRNVVEASDGRAVAISATTDAQLARLHELAGDDVAAWVAARSAAAAVDALVGARVPAVEVNDIPQLRADEHVVARNSITTVDGMTIPSPAPRLSASPGVIAHVGPGLGDHTDEVVAEWLDGGPA